MGVTINRTPRDGHMAFVRYTDNMYIAILKEGNLESNYTCVSMCYVLTL